VHNTCLTHLSTTSQHLLAGTQRGDIRRYDTRVARKPVAEWKQIVPTGRNSGVGVIENGFHEQYVRRDVFADAPFFSLSPSINAWPIPYSEVFVSDQTSNLFAIDTRKGRVIYGYKGDSLSFPSVMLALNFIFNIV
jgi:ribosome biogenesis protein NSA1